MKYFWPCPISAIPDFFFILALIALKLVGTTFVSGLRITKNGSDELYCLHCLIKRNRTTFGRSQIFSSFLIYSNPDRDVQSLEFCSGSPKIGPTTCTHRPGLCEHTWVVHLKKACCIFKCTVKFWHFIIHCMDACVWTGFHSVSGACTYGRGLH